MDWLKHDIDTQRDIKIKKLIKSSGYEGYGLFWHVMELLYINGGKIRASELEDELELLDCKGFDEVLLRIGLVELDDDGMISSKRVIEEVNKQKIFAEAGKKGSEVRWGKGSDSHPKATLKPDDSDPIASDSRLRLRDKKDTSDNKLSSVWKEAAQIEPKFIEFPTNDGQLFPVAESKVTELEALYPAVDVRQQLRNMRGWLDGNPRNRKTRGGMLRFINSWLSREQNRGRPAEVTRKRIVEDPTERSRYVRADGSIDLLGG